MNSNVLLEGNVHRIENISLDMVKLEPEEDCPQNDPFGELKEGTGSFVDRKVKIVEEELPIEENTSPSDDVETNFRQALDKNIDHEILSPNGMEFECEDYKFSIADIAPVTNAIANDDDDDDDDQSLSDSSIEDEPHKNVQTHKPASSIAPIKKRPANKHRCNQCNRKFDRPNKLLLHIKDRHEGIRDHACQQCDKRYVTSYELQVHLRIHTGERPYICDECGVSYAYPNILAKHKKTKHSGLRPHVCHICDKRFTLQGYLTDHLRIHSGERPFACNQCDMAFNRSTSLKMHMKAIHQKIRSHACPLCDKRFTTSGGLKIHSVTHTGERSYACDQCDKSFSQLHQRKLHQNSVHKQLRPYACKDCDKRFKTPTHLKQHVTIHTGVKAYTCDQCNKSFALGHHLSSHKKSVHKQKA